ncbi:PREDICTED: zinc finger SWIM domain-containing protein 7 isoform X1 [Crocodylus porosus]|uniref:zinc finger SWIM domain-containing protein 7 isoform X1 n=1 Tax=Crocodylus porosus TaxID=8502 RepID=UPI00093C2ED9|nr:PREDICTED: zinc finger SWIM domain-containing protein 7 isoform X1 [Crocodylus porosus]
MQRPGPGPAAAAPGDGFDCISDDLGTTLPAVAEELLREIKKTFQETAQVPDELLLATESVSSARGQSDQHRNSRQLCCRDAELGLDFSFPAFFPEQRGHVCFLLSSLFAHSGSPECLLFALVTDPGFGEFSLGMKGPQSFSLTPELLGTGSQAGRKSTSSSTPKPRSCLDNRCRVQVSSPPPAGY